MTTYAEKLLPHDLEAEEAVLGSVLMTATYAEKLPLPHDLEAEEAVLGSVLIDGDLFGTNQR